MRLHISPRGLLLPFIIPKPPAQPTVVVPRWGKRALARILRKLFSLEPSPLKRLSSKRMSPSSCSSTPVQDLIKVPALHPAGPLWCLGQLFC